MNLLILLSHYKIKHILIRKEDVKHHQETQSLKKLTDIIWKRDDPLKNIKLQHLLINASK